MALDRTNFNAWVDEPPGGDGSSGTKLTEARIASDILDPIDAEIARMDADIAGVTAGVSVFNRDVTVNEVVSTASETTVYTNSITGGTLGSTKMLRVTCLADYLNNDGAGRTLTIKLKYGATTFAQYSLSLGNVATRRPVLIQSWLSALNATGAQAGGAIFSVENAVGVAGEAGASLGNSGGSVHSAVAEDSTAAKTLAITVQHSASSANLSFRLQVVHVELV